MKIAPLNNEVAETDEVGVAYWINSEDEVRLRVGVWQDHRTTNGTILFFTGRTEFIEKYGRTIPTFLKQGFAAFLIDWRGQGLSDRVAVNTHIGHIDSFYDYQKDVSAMMQAAAYLDLPKPWYLVGNSMGGCIGLRSLTDRIPVVASAFIAPMWNIKLPPYLQYCAKSLTRLASISGGGGIYTKSQKGKSYALHRSFESNSVTNDLEMYNYFIRQAISFPEAHIGAPSMRWLNEALTECDRLSTIPSPDVPCSVYIGEDDLTVGRKEIDDRMSNWGKGSLTTFKNAKHDLLCEKPTISEMVIQDICTFFRRYS